MQIDKVIKIESEISELKILKGIIEQRIRQKIKNKKILLTQD